MEMRHLNVRRAITEQLKNLSFNLFENENLSLKFIDANNSSRKIMNASRKQIIQAQMQIIQAGNLLYMQIIQAGNSDECKQSDL